MRRDNNAISTDELAEAINRTRIYFYEKPDNDSNTVENVIFHLLVELGEYPQNKRYHHNIDSTKKSI